MMAAVKPFVETGQENATQENLLDLLNIMGVSLSFCDSLSLSTSVRAICSQADLQECGKVLDVYKKQKSIGSSSHFFKEAKIFDLHFTVRFIKSNSWQDMLMEFAEKFIQHQRDIGLCLAVHNYLDTTKILNSVHEILRQKSTTELAFQQFVEDCGGLEECVNDDELFVQLVHKSGTPIDLNEAQVIRPYVVHHRTEYYVPAVKYLPISGHFLYTARYKQPQGTGPSDAPVFTANPLPSIDILPSPHSPPPPPSPPSTVRHSHYRHHERATRRSRSPSPASEQQGSEPLSLDGNTQSFQDDLKNPILAQIKVEVKSALETDLDVLIQQQAAVWTVKFTYLTRGMQSSIESSRDQILKAVESGQHELLHDAQMQKIWQSEVSFSLIFLLLWHVLWQKWRRSISSPTLLEGIHECFWQFFQDAVAQGDCSQPVWTLQFMEKPFWTTLTEVLDADQSGLISVAEVNNFTDRKPQDLRCVPRLHLAWSDISH